MKRVGNEASGVEEREEDYLRTATRFYAASKPFLAIKAYERALSEMEDDVSTSDSMPSIEGTKLVLRNTLFKDLILHCNAFGVKSIGTDIKVAEDFLRLCLKELHGRNYIQGNLDTNDSSYLFVPEQSDKGVLFLVSLTLNNWACLLLRSGHTKRAAAFLEVALGNSVAEELSRIILLNMCVVCIYNCSFSEARDKAMDVILEGEEKQNNNNSTEEERDDDGQEKLFEDDVIRGDVNGLISAFGYHNLAIAEEYLQPQAAEDHYNQAKELLVSNPYQQWSHVIESARKRFHDIIQRRREEAAWRREANEAEIEAARQAEAAVWPRGKGVRGAAARRPSVKPVSRTKKRKSVSGTVNDAMEEPVELPHVSEYVQEKIRSQGLNNIAVPLLRVMDVGNAVFKNKETFEESFFPFRENTNSNTVAMVLVCDETPLQVVDEVELKGITPPKKTIWCPFPPREESITMIPLIKTKPTPVLSPEVVNMVKPFMHPPLSEKAIENAQRSVAAFKKLLNHRLMILLRAENAFEEKWKATIIVKSALVAFNFAQDMVKLKETMKKKRDMQTILESVSARRIVRFFKLVLGREYSNDLPISKKSRVRYFEEKGAITLQKYAKRWLAIRELRRLQEEHRKEILKVMKIQSIYHMHVERGRYLAYKEEIQNKLKEEKEIATREFAATQIQRAYRRHLYKLSKWREGDMRQFILHHFKLSREYYANLIQKVFRGYLVRRVYGPIVYAKRYYGRNCYRAALLNGYATVIQRKFRGYLVRRTTNTPLRQRFVQRIREKMDLEAVIQNEAAKVIQCAYRCLVARNVVRQLRAVREKERLLRRNRVYPSFRLEEQVY